MIFADNVVLVDENTKVLEDELVNSGERFNPCSPPSHLASLPILLNLCHGVRFGC